MQKIILGTEHDYPNDDNNFEKIINSTPMRYSEELRKYLTEVYEIIPVLREMNCLNIFWKRNILLSMDEGFGIQDFLSALLSVYIERKIICFVSAEKGIREFVIEKNEDNAKDMYSSWDELVKELKMINTQNHQKQGICAIVYIDISQWVGDIHSNKLGSYINKIRDLSNNFIYVFRMPFMEKDIIEEVYGRIADSMSLKCLAVSPISMDSMVEYITTRLESAGYKNVDEWSEFIERGIIAERNDNNFFGYKTLDKIITDILYEQALVNIQEQKINDKLMAEKIFRLDEISEDRNPWATLEQLIGLESVKIQLKEIVAQIKIHDKISHEGRPVERPSIHMMFAGNPGTGKTTVARLVSEIFKVEGILPKGNLIEVRGRDLCGRYIGETAPKTATICRDAYGSVLFIDEAYSLFREENSGRDFGREALDTLVAEMENHRNDLCVILAGYTDEMQELLKGNIGLESRIRYIVEFPNYSKEELETIFFNMIGNNFSYSEDFKTVVHEYLQNLPTDFINRKEFSNARFVRNLYERTWGKAAFRSNFIKLSSIELTKTDFESAIKSGEALQFEKKKHRRIGFY